MHRLLKVFGSVPLNVSYFMYPFLWSKLGGELMFSNDSESGCVISLYESFYWMTSKLGGRTDVGMITDVGKITDVLR